jgi:hypothetical protein
MIPDVTTDALQCFADAWNRHDSELGRKVSTAQNHADY